MNYKYLILFLFIFQFNKPVISQIYYYGTPSQVTRQMMVNNMQQAVQSVLEGRNTVETINKDFLQIRENFWVLYPNGAGIEKIRNDYQKLLLSRDMIYILYEYISELNKTMDPAYSDNFNHTKLFINLFGEIGGGIPKIAKDEYDTWKSNVFTYFRSKAKSILDVASFMEAINANQDSYAKYLIKIDKFEYLYANPYSPLYSRIPEIQFQGILIGAHVCKDLTEAKKYFQDISLFVSTEDLTAGLEDFYNNYGYGKPANMYIRDNGHKPNRIISNLEWFISRRNKQNYSLYLIKRRLSCDWKTAEIILKNRKLRYGEATVTELQDKVWKEALDLTQKCVGDPNEITNDNRLSRINLKYWQVHANDDCLAVALGDSVSWLDLYDYAKMNANSEALRSQVAKFLEVTLEEYSSWAKVANINLINYAYFIRTKMGKNLQMSDATLWIPDFTKIEKHDQISDEETFYRILEGLAFGIKDLKTCSLVMLRFHPDVTDQSLAKAVNLVVKLNKLYGAEKLIEQVRLLDYGVPPPFVYDRDNTYSFFTKFAAEVESEMKARSQLRVQKSLDMMLPDLYSEIQTKYPGVKSKDVSITQLYGLWYTTYLSADADNYETLNFMIFNDDGTATYTGPRANRNITEYVTLKNNLLTYKETIDGYNRITYSLLLLTDDDHFQTIYLGNAKNYTIDSLRQRLNMSDNQPNRIWTRGIDVTQSDILLDILSDSTYKICKTPCQSVDRSRLGLYRGELRTPGSNIGKYINDREIMERHPDSSPDLVLINKDVQAISNWESSFSTEPLLQRGPNGELWVYARYYSEFAPYKIRSILADQIEAISFSDFEHYKLDRFRNALRQSEFNNSKGIPSVIIKSRLKEVEECLCSEERLNQIEQIRDALELLNEANLLKLDISMEYKAIQENFKTPPSNAINFGYPLMATLVKGYWSRYYDNCYKLYQEIKDGAIKKYEPPLADPIPTIVPAKTQGKKRKN